MNQAGNKTRSTRRRVPPPRKRTTPQPTSGGRSPRRYFLAMALLGLATAILLGSGTFDRWLSRAAAGDTPVASVTPKREPSTPAARPEPTRAKEKPAVEDQTVTPPRTTDRVEVWIDPKLGAVPVVPALAELSRKTPAVALATDPSPRRELALDPAPVPEVKGLSSRKIADEYRKEKKDFATLLDMAEQAIRKDAIDPGGHYLKCIALLTLSRNEKDHAPRLKTLDKARGALVDASMRLKADEDKSELSHFYRVWSSLCLEQAMFSPERSKQVEVFRDAEKHARKAVELDGKNREAWEALAYAEASAAWILKENDRNRSSLEAYNKAIEGCELVPDCCQLWVGRGKCRFRIGTVGAGDAKLLDDAEADLKEVADNDKTRDRPEAAEALYHIALIARERRTRLEKDDKPDADKRAQLLTREEKALERALKVAREAKEEVWEEFALRGWITLAITEAAARKKADKPDARDWLDRIEKLARQLEPINPVEAMLARVQAASIAGRTPDEVLRLMADAPARVRLQDQASLVNLLIVRGHYHLSVRPADLDAASRDADEAERLAGKNDVDVSARVGLLGLEGVIKLLSADARPSERARMRAEAIAHFREAVRIAPDHPHNWFWRWLQARLLWLKDNRSAEEREEAERRIVEARERVPTSAPRPYRDALEATYRMIHDR